MKATDVRLILISLLGAPAVVCIWLVLAGQKFDVVFLCTASTLAIVPVFALWLLQRPFDCFGPLGFVTLSVLLGTTLRAFYLVFSSNKEITDWLLYYVPLRTMLPGAVIMLMTTTGIAIGYAIAPRFRVPLEKLKLMRGTVSLNRLTALFLVLCVLGTIAGADFLRRTGFKVESIADISSKRRAEVEGSDIRASFVYHRWAASALLAPAFYILLISYYTSPAAARHRIRPFLICAAVAPLILPFLASSRSTIGYVLICGMVILHHLGRIKLGQLAAVGVSIIIMICVMRGLRNQEMKGADYVWHVLTGATVADDLLGNRNFAGLTKTAHIYAAVPHKFPRQNGQTLLRWTYAWIPRAVWKNKPPVSLGDELRKRIFYRFSTLRFGGGFPPGLAGEMILNFGLPGVFLGAGIYGFFLRVFYNSFQPLFSKNPMALVIYVQLLIPLSFLHVGGEMTRTVNFVVMNLAALLPYVVFGVFRASAGQPAPSTSYAVAGR